MDLKNDHMELEPLLNLIRAIEEFYNSFMTSELCDTLLQERSAISYAYEPVLRTIPDNYHQNNRVNVTIQTVLNECMISIKRRGYSYMRDAVCIISDLHTYDIIMNKDIYPRIAEKYGIKGYDSIDHDIRTALDAAYNTYLRSGGAVDSPLGHFSQRPTPKKFLLYISQEVNSRVFSDTCGS